VKFTIDDLKKLIIQESRNIREAEIINFNRARGLPWEFGPEGYTARGRGHEKHFSFISNDPNKKIESILAVALAIRAEWLLDPDGESDGIEVDVEPSMFAGEASNLAYALNAGEFDIRTQESDEVEQAGVDYLVGRIDSDSFDELIAEHLYSEFGVVVPGFEYVQEIEGFHEPVGEFDDPIADMFKTKDLAAQQPSKDVEEMSLDFEKYMKGIDKGDIIEFPGEED